MSIHQSQPPKRVTIKDVAHAAGVSVTTVSNVLNNRTEAMAEETLHRIQEAIVLLDYRPSRVARSLVTSSTSTLGVIIAEIETPHFLQALNFIEPVARSAGYDILLCTAKTLDDEEQSVNLLLEKQVDGIIFLSTSTYFDDDFWSNLPSIAPPVVLINRPKIYNNHFDQINFDNTTGVLNAIKNLAQQGHRHIAHLSGPENRHSTTERLQGYRLGLEYHHFPWNADYVRPSNYEKSQEGWAQSTRDLLATSPRPTAIIAVTDEVAAIAARTIQQAGLHIPQDISVIGVDDQPICTFLNPTLTSIQLPVIEAGKYAVQMLLERISGQRSTPKHIILPCRLIERESSGPVPRKEKV